MPNKRFSGKDAFEYVGVKTSSDLKSKSALVNVTVSPAAIQIIAESKDIIAPQGSAFIITLSGFSFNSGVSERANAFITVLPSLVRLFQHDGTPLGTQQQANQTSGAISSNTSVMITDLQRRVKVEISADAGGIPYDFLEFKLVDPVSNSHSVAVVVQFNIWCRAGFYMSSNSSDLRCLPCDYGQFTPKLHSNKACQLCPAGSTSATASSFCSPCQPGSYAPIIGTKKCMPCEPGYIAAQASMKTCDSCPSGSFNPLFGQTKCRPCGNYGYSTQKASTSCLDCPLLTRSGNPQSGSIEFCECEAGSYRSDLSAGKECKPCPTGAFCHGRTIPPVTRTGFWTSPSDWPEESVAQFWMCDHKGVRNVCLGFPDIRQLEDVLKCSYRQVDGICDDIGSHIYINISNYDKRRCANGYSGRLCSVCEKGHYKSSSGSCEQCPSIGVVMIGIVVVLFVFVCIIVAVSSTITTLYITVCWLQLLACFSNLSISWPPTLARLWGFVTIFNFNFRVAPSSCLFSSEANWKDAWFFEVLIFSIVIAVNAIRWALPYYSSKAKLNPSAIRSLSLKQNAISNGKGMTPGYHRPSRPSSAASSDSRESGSKLHFKDKVHPDIAAPNEWDGDALDEVDMPNINPAILEDYASTSGHTGSFTHALEHGYTSDKKIRHEAAIQQLFHKAAGPQKARSELVSRHGDASDASSAASSLNLAQWEGVSPGELRYIIDSGVWTCQLLACTFFTFGATTALKAISCRQFNEKVSILVEDPSVSCFTSEHFGIFGMALPLIVVNMCLPIFFTVYIFLYGKKKGILQDEGFCSRYGFLMERYEHEFYWWEIVVFTRKAATAVIIVLLHDDINLQVILLGALYIFVSCVTLYVRPFKQERHNVLEAVLHCALVIMLFLIFINPTDILLLSQFSEARESFLVFLQIGMLLFMVAICMRTIREEILSSQISLPTAVDFLIATIHTIKLSVETKVRSIVGNLVRRVVDEHQRYVVQKFTIIPCFHQKFKTRHFQKNRVQQRASRCKNSKRLSPSAGRQRKK
jgi:hypothetical protein